MAITLAPRFMAFLEASTVSGVLPPSEQVITMQSSPTQAGVACTNSLAVNRIVLSFFAFPSKKYLAG